MRYYCMMEDVRNWLNGERDYHSGRQIYFQYGDDPALISLFKNESISSFKQERLFKAMRELYINSKKKSKPAEKVTTRAEKPAPKSWKKGEKDKVLIALRKQWEPAFKEMKMLHAQLLLMTSDSERGAAAHRILDLDEVCTSIYERRDYYNEHGRLPEEKKPDEVVDPEKYALRLESAKRYIRRYNNKLKKDPTNEKHAALLKKYKEEVAYYKQKLKIDE